jgi:hypothetical protein
VRKGGAKARKGGVKAKKVAKNYFFCSDGRRAAAGRDLMRAARRKSVMHHYQYVREESDARKGCVAPEVLEWAREEARIAAESVSLSVGCDGTCRLVACRVVLPRAPSEISQVLDFF